MVFYPIVYSCVQLWFNGNTLKGVVLENPLRVHLIHAFVLGLFRSGMRFTANEMLE